MTNKNRNRSYGLRVGDFVKNEWWNVELAIVTLRHADNNRVTLHKFMQKEIETTAESCEIVQRVDDLPGYNDDMNESQMLEIALKKMYL